MGFKPTTTQHKIDQIKDLGFDLTIQTGPKGWHAVLYKEHKGQPDETISLAFGEDLDVIMARLLKVACDYEPKKAEPKDTSGFLGRPFAEVIKQLAGLPPTPGCDCPACTNKRKGGARHREDGLREEMAAENQKAEWSGLNTQQAFEKAMDVVGGMTPPEAQRTPEAEIQNEVQRIMTEATLSIQRLVTGLRAVH